MWTLSGFADVTDHDFTTQCEVASGLQVSRLGDRGSVPHPFQVTAFGAVSGPELFTRT